MRNTSGEIGKKTKDFAAFLQPFLIEKKKKQQKFLKIEKKLFPKGNESKAFSLWGKSCGYCG